MKETAAPVRVRLTRLRRAEAELVRGRMMFRAVETIAAGDEITIDYGEEYVELYFAKSGCKCVGCKEA